MKHSKIPRNFASHQEVVAHRRDFDKHARRSYLFWVCAFSWKSASNRRPLVAAKKVVGRRSSDGRFVDDCRVWVKTNRADLRDAGSITPARCAYARMSNASSERCDSIAFDWIGVEKAASRYDGAVSLRTVPQHFAEHCLPTAVRRLDDHFHPPVWQMFSKRQLEARFR